jgi:hypothetical protein
VRALGTEGLNTLKTTGIEDMTAMKNGIQNLDFNKEELISLNGQIDTIIENFEKLGQEGAEDL